jgi:hypothetical protein
MRPSGFAGLAADVDLVTHRGSPEVVLAASGAAHALLALAVFRLLCRSVSPTAAAWSAAGVGLAIVAAGALTSGLVLGLALALVAVPHVISRQRAPSVAAGVLLGASALAAGIAVPLAALGVGAVLRFRAGPRSRAILTAGVALSVVSPALPGAGAQVLLRLPVLSRVRSAEQRPTPDDRAAMSWLRNESDVLAVVCAVNTPGAAWIPGVTGRSLVLDGRAQPVPAGVTPSLTQRDCTMAYVTSLPAMPVRRDTRTLFQSGPVTLVEIHKSLP